MTEQSNHILDNLSVLIDGLTNTPSRDDKYALYGIFLRDIKNNPILIEGKRVEFNTDISMNPVCRGKEKGYEHIITRKISGSRHRAFDKHRANKIHWIRPVIENVENDRVKYFEKVHHSGYNQRFYWFEEKNFNIIIREKSPDLLLITAFSVDSDNQHLQRFYEEYLETL